MTTDVPGAHGLDLKKNISPVDDDTQENRKTGPTEVKRKNSKRTFKSKKEFLEFTMKYQQTLAEKDAAIAAWDKLESLCRELQWQNKMLRDECKKVSTNGQSLKTELLTKFEEAIKNVSIKQEAQKYDSLIQIKDNGTFRNKIHQFSDQFTLTEQTYAQKLKHKDLELQLADLKIKQHEEKLIQEQS